MSVQQPQLRRRKPLLKAVEDIDVFPKVPETCMESTSYGGSAFLVALVVIAWLMILEISAYLDTEYKFRFSPDMDIDSKLSISVDITVAMPCGIVGADIVDSTNQNVLKFGELEEEFCHFELHPRQRAYFNAKSSFNSYLREQYHSLNKLLWKNDFINRHSEMPKLTAEEKHSLGNARACRLHGTLELNKVAGNFHITAGKTLPLPRGHAHIAAFMSEKDYNFSHRIEKFSFGDGSSSVVHPLEGDEKVAQHNQMLFQYFIQIVPTIVKTKFRTYQTFQYSVRELEREIDHGKGSHGISGIFFKYDMSGLKVEVTEESYPLSRLLVRLCAVIGGVYATVGMVYNHLSFFGRLAKYIRCKNENYYGNSQSSGYSNFSASPHLSSEPLIRNGKQSGKSQQLPSESAKRNNISLTFQTPVIDLVQPQLVSGSEQIKIVPVKDQSRLPDILASHSS